MTAALAAGARPQLVELNGPANANVVSAVRVSLPVTYSEAAVSLTPDSDGIFSLTLAEGDYLVTPLLAPVGRSFGNQIPQPVTSAVYTMKATSGSLDLESADLKVSGPGQEVQIVFIPTKR